MRLIDADKIGEVSADPYEEAAFQGEIKDQPTVEAIPVEWIEKRIRAGINFALNDPREGTTEERDGIVHCISGAFAAQVLMNTITLWRQENGTDRQEQTP